MERYIRLQNRLLRPKPNPPPLPECRQWIRSLEVGDVIITDRDESLVVVKSYNKTIKTKDCCRVKRSHLKEPQVLKSCKEFDDCVEFCFQNSCGFSQYEFKRWTVIKANSTH
jgi:hypothetical protein